jgi:dTDP-4-dehydrorhamnose 3,5-epimerase
MKLHKSALNDVLWMEPELLIDARGFFAETYCENDWAKFSLVQCNISHNDKAQTLRGLHYQKAPYQQDKYLTCTHGIIQDVIIDLREDSSTYLKWDSFILSRENRQWLYIPKGFAHGYLTLTDDVDIFYQMSQFYEKDYEAGIRWDDPTFDIFWLKEPLIISERDQRHPDFKKD